MPERITGATLIDVMREAEVAWGVNAFYRLEVLPEARLDLFVYPARRMRADEGARAGQDGFRRELDIVRSQGLLDQHAIEFEQRYPIAMADGAPLDAIKTKLVVIDENDRRASRAYLAWNRKRSIALPTAPPPSCFPGCRSGIVVAAHRSRSTGSLQPRPGRPCQRSKSATTDAVSACRTATRRSS
ncbi:MAG: hypothetical protein ABI650_07500 [Dokdonella sp.]